MWRIGVARADYAAPSGLENRDDCIDGNWWKVEEERRMRKGRKDANYGDQYRSHYTVMSVTFDRVRPPMRTSFAAPCYRR